MKLPCLLMTKQKRTQNLHQAKILCGCYYYHWLL